MSDIADIERRLMLATWHVEIAEARRGKPQGLAKLIVAEPIPDDLKRDVEFIVANPVHVRRSGGRPSKRPSDDFAMHEMKRLFRTLVDGFPAGEDYAALEPYPKAQVLEAFARHYDVDEKTVRNWLDLEKPPRSKRKNTRR